jgi:hypothetical protein
LAYPWQYQIYPEIIVIVSSKFRDRADKEENTFFIITFSTCVFINHFVGKFWTWIVSGRSPGFISFMSLFSMKKLSQSYLKIVVAFENVLQKSNGFNRTNNEGKMLGYFQ